jgi:hypothetical protein
MPGALHLGCDPKNPTGHIGLRYQRDTLATLRQSGRSPKSRFSSAMRTISCSTSRATRGGLGRDVSSWKSTFGGDDLAAWVVEAGGSDRIAGSVDGAGQAATAFANGANGILGAVGPAVGEGQ